MTTGVQLAKWVKKNPLVPNEGIPGDKVYDDTKPPAVKKPLPPAPTSPTLLSRKNILRPDNLLDEDSKPPASKGASPPHAKPTPKATRGLRADSAGMAVALNSQRFKPKLAKRGGMGGGRQGERERSDPDTLK